MRWLLEWLVRGVAPTFPSRSGPLARLRRCATRLRLRAEYHRDRRRSAQVAFDDASRRVQLLELSEEAEVQELVEARKSLLQARDALGHHHQRLREVAGLREKVRRDRRLLEGGREPEHWEAYAGELDG